jgi:hypothetical protein
MKTKQNIVVLVAFLGIANLCCAQYAKLSPDFGARGPEEPVNVIVQYKNAPEQHHIDGVIRRGGRHLRTLGAVKGAVYSVAAKTLADLANDPDVKYVSPDRPVKASSITWPNLSTTLTQDFKVRSCSIKLTNHASSMRRTS